MVFWYSFQGSGHLFDILVSSGFDLPSPDSLNDSEISAKLWELINFLSLISVFLHCTNHLSDRGLYERLWYNSLREGSFSFQYSTSFHAVYHIDMVGSGSEEDIFNYLRYYASKENRLWWQNNYPEENLPAHEKAPYDRDKHLPKYEKFETGCC
ncbi:MAG: hypothetical protein K9K88_06545 [Desulfobacterales bacterium]|nr:hypothetical protein [Desulfobacterales bacterium]